MQWKNLADKIYWWYWRSTDIYFEITLHGTDSVQTTLKHKPMYF